MVAGNLVAAQFNGCNYYLLHDTSYFFNQLPSHPKRWKETFIEILRFWQKSMMPSNKV